MIPKRHKYAKSDTNRRNQSRHRCLCRVVSLSPLLFLCCAKIQLFRTWFYRRDRAQQREYKAMHLKLGSVLFFVQGHFSSCWAEGSLHTQLRQRTTDSTQQLFNQHSNFPPSVGQWTVHTNKIFGIKSKLRRIILPAGPGVRTDRRTYTRHRPGLSPSRLVISASSQPGYHLYRKWPTTANHHIWSDEDAIMRKPYT